MIYSIYGGGLHEILVANAGSTSFKYRLFSAWCAVQDAGSLGPFGPSSGLRAVALGRITNIEYERSDYSFEHGGRKGMEALGRISFEDAVDIPIGGLCKDGLGRIDAVGFKTVHAGRFRGARSSTGTSSNPRRSTSRSPPPTTGTTSTSSRFS
jgi:hypothetical protein